MTACSFCRAATVAAVRYDREGNVTDVRLCLDCGAEDPPFGLCCKRSSRVASAAECARCGAPLIRPDRHRYCSHRCYSEAKRVGTVRVVCPCGQPFGAPDYLTRQGRGKYCSAVCQRRFRPRRLAS